MSEEIWKPVVGAESFYEVSNLGRVRSLRFRNNMVNRQLDEPKILKPQVATKGHLGVYLSGSIKKRRSIHRLVLEAFIGPCPDGLECAHGNGNPADNRVENLRWATRKENHADKKRHGTHMAGDTHPMAKLSSRDVIEIRKRIENGERTIDVAKEFGISRKTVWDLRRRSWAHVKKN